MSPERTIGETLRQAREARGLSQEAVGRETRLSLAVLRALESDRLGDMPGELYTANAIRILADYLELDRVELMARAREMLGAAGERPQAAADGVWREEVPETRVAGWRPGPRLIGGVILLVVLAAALWWWLAGRSRTDAATSAQGAVDTAQERPAATPPPAVEEARPADSAAEEAAPPPQEDLGASNAAADTLPAAPAGPAWTEGPVSLPGQAAGTTLRREPALRVTLRALAPCRVQLNVDDRRTVARAMVDGETWTVAAEQFIVLNTTESQALALTVNGETRSLPTPPSNGVLALRIDAPEGGD